MKTLKRIKLIKIIIISEVYACIRNQYLHPNNGVDEEKHGDKQADIR